MLRPVSRLNRATSRVGDTGEVAMNSSTLPYEEFAIPPGPSRERFQVSCTICHSPRLAFTQPRLLEKKWQEVVHKMVAVYGAPLSADEELEIVSYLSAVHGQTAP